MELFSELLDGEGRQADKHVILRRVERTLEERGPMGMVIFTDGSVEEGVRNRGAAVVTGCRAGKRWKSGRLLGRCTVGFDRESRASECVYLY